MLSTTSQLTNVLNDYLPRLKAISEKDFSEKPFPDKWSKREILGHLIDSAHNNIRRLIVAQYEENPTIVYKQEKWVTIAAYQNWNSSSVIQLWHLLNLQFVHVLEQMPAENYGRSCSTGSTHTLEWLAQDYVKHLLHHLHVILELEPVPYR